MFGDQQTLNAGFDFDHYRDNVNTFSTTRLSMSDTLGTSLSRRMTQGGGFFLQNQFNFGKLSITPGARLDFYSINGSVRYRTVQRPGDPLKDHTQTNSIPQVSLEASYEILNKTSLFMSVMSDHDNIAPGYIAANNNPGVDPALSPTNVWKYEAGVRGQLRPWIDYTGSLFWMDNDNQFVVNTVNGASQYSNARRSEIKGVEGQFRVVLTHLWQDLIEQKRVYEPTKWGDLALSGNVTLMDSQVVSGDQINRQMPVSPDFLIKGGVYYNYGDTFKVNLTGMWVEEYFSTVLNSTSTPSTVAANVPTFMVWDFNAEYWVIKNRLRFIQNCMP
jgi:outer membrane receptor for Fe3+-dicitrate